jgi:FdhD protein
MGGINGTSPMSDTAFADFTMPTSPPWRSVQALRFGLEGTSSPGRADVAEEVPIAFRYGGFSHAVMMATPEDLVDFSLGFSQTEGFIETEADVSDLSMRERADGIEIDISLRPAALHRYLANRRVRQLRGNPSCGVCGVQDLKDIQRPAGRVNRGSPLDRRLVQQAFGALRDLQVLSRRTRGAHAAAWVGVDGAIETMREDVGRHNALDKLIGAGMRGAFPATAGFCLITSRCSFEMVQKAVAARYGTLVSAAAPTALAIRSAMQAGLTLLCLSRGDEQVLYAAPDLAEGATP